MGSIMSESPPPTSPTTPKKRGKKALDNKLTVSPKYGKLASLGFSTPINLRVSENWDNDFEFDVSTDKLKVPKAMRASSNSLCTDLWYIRNLSQKARDLKKSLNLIQQTLLKQSTRALTNDNYQDIADAEAVVELACEEVTHFDTERAEIQSNNNNNNTTKNIMLQNLLSRNHSNTTASSLESDFETFEIDNDEELLNDYTSNSCPNTATPRIPSSSSSSLLSLSSTSTESTLLIDVDTVPLLLDKVMVLKNRLEVLLAQIQSQNDLNSS